MGIILLALTIWCICGVGAAVVASSRGASGCAWFALGFLLGPLGFALAFTNRLPECPYCKKGVPTGAVKCPSCQSDLSTPAGASSQFVATRKCPFCAETILGEAKKCRFCGEFLETVPEALALPSPPHRTKSVPPWGPSGTSPGTASPDRDAGANNFIYFIVAAGIVVMAVVVYLVASNRAPSSADKIMTEEEIRDVDCRMTRAAYANMPNLSEESQRQLDICNGITPTPAPGKAEKSLQQPQRETTELLKNNK
jgi:hypothetical protein